MTTTTKRTKAMFRRHLSGEWVVEILMLRARPLRTVSVRRRDGSKSEVTIGEIYGLGQRPGTVLCSIVDRAERNEIHRTGVVEAARHRNGVLVDRYGEEL